MTSRHTGGGRRHLPRLSAAMRERESVLPLELFFDLVYVLCFTQCTALMTADPYWSGLGHGMLMLAVLWWAWTAYAWLTSVVDPEDGGVRVAMFAAMAGILIAALCVPEAFGDRAMTFAIAYGAVRVGHIALYWITSHGDEALRGSVVVIAVGTAVGVGLLLTAAAVDGTARTLCWLAAIVLDWGAPMLFGIEGWRLVPAHFSERHNLVIILALGESIVSLAGGGHVDLTGKTYAAAALGVALAAAIWWTYFDIVALVTERRLAQAAEGRVRNALARDSYDLLHFPMVAGIILVAFGLEQTLERVGAPLHTVPRFALLGGTALYLLAHVTLRLRNAHSVNWQRLGLAVLLVALWPATAHLDAIVLLALVDLLFWAMVAYETSQYGEGRYRLRHGLMDD